MNCSTTKECFDMIQITKVKHGDCKNVKCLIGLDKRKTVSIEENKKKYLLTNDGSTLGIFHIDGGMIDDSTIVRCDNMVLILEHKKAFLIELKGSDLVHALEQIESSYKLFSPQLPDFSFEGKIVTSSKTNVPNIKINKDYLRVSKLLKQKLIVKENQLLESL